MNQTTREMSAPAEASTTCAESLDSLDSLFTVALHPCPELTPHASRARALNSVPYDFEQVSTGVASRQTDPPTLHRWSLGHGRRLAPQERQSSFRRVWMVPL